MPIQDLSMHPDQGRSPTDSGSGVVEPRLTLKDHAKVMGAGTLGKHLGTILGAGGAELAGEAMGLGWLGGGLATLGGAGAGRQGGKMLGKHLMRDHILSQRTPETPKLAVSAPSLEAPTLDAPKAPKLDGPKPEDGLKPPKLKMDPLPHQQRVSKNLQTSPGLVAMHGLGTGKTFTAINAAHDQNSPLIAVTPAALRNNMKKEIEASGFKNPFHVLSYEQAAKKVNDPEFQQLARNSVVAYDEAHRTGQATSARSKLPTNLNAKKKLFLTGTPIRNEPQEIAPMVNAIEPGSLPNDPAEFKRKFMETREVPVGFFGRLKGVKPGRESRPINLHDFEKSVQGKIDYHENVDRGDFPSFSESIVEVPMTNKQQSTYNFVMGKYPALAYKIRHGLPLTKRETKNFRSFMIGPRQVSNFPSAFNSSARAEDAAKITKTVDEVQQRVQKDPNYRGVTYSSFLETGVNPVSQALAKANVPHAVFTGEQNDEERKKIVEDYNTGKIKQLLISGAGAEGLDLKGTKLMQILEPHWNEELINQVRGRSIRYKSHSHLPEDERHVEVQRYHSVPRKGLMDKLMRRKRAKQRGSDEYLYNLATEKQRINEPFLRILRGESADEVTKGTEKKSGLEIDPAVENARRQALKFAASLYYDVPIAPDGWSISGDAYVRCYQFGFSKTAAPFADQARKEATIREIPPQVEVGESFDQIWVRVPATADGCKLAAVIDDLFEDDFFQGGVPSARVAYDLFREPSPEVA